MARRGRAGEGSEEPKVRATRRLRAAHEDEYDELYAAARAAGANYAQAQGRAYWGLVARHRDEYDRLYADATAGRERKERPRRPVESLTDATLRRAQRRLTAQMRARTLRDAEMVAEWRRRVIARAEAGELSREAAMRALGCRPSTWRMWLAAYRAGELWSLEPTVYQAPPITRVGRPRIPAPVVSVIHQLADAGLTTDQVVEALAAEGEKLSRNGVWRHMRARRMEQAA